MKPRIEQLAEIKLIGYRLTMSLAQDRTLELWKSFMPRRNEIKNSLNTNCYCVQVYQPDLTLNNFNADTIFDKWASVAVDEFKEIPVGMESYTLTGGLYAVFLYKGPASEGFKIFQYIFGTWIPNSSYTLDNSRAHFQILDDKYKNEDPTSEEELWIPIK
ncbi:MAG TPA: GyrI-like domain-containing protein [Cytophagaceae bacterium]|jgi:AraC family transcriptional regulator|nr:GyrI-like domain-containing protein [Cytophagaceae bacterium]